MSHAANTVSQLTPKDVSRSSVDRFFEIALLLMLGTGFITLASTGRLDGIAVVLVFVALFVRLWGYASGRSLHLSPRAVTILAFAYVPFFILDFLVFSASGNLLESMLAATVHLILFATVAKVFSATTQRDYTYLSALSLLMILASAVLTVNSTFLVFLTLYILFAIATFVSYEIKRSVDASLRPGSNLLLVGAKGGRGLERALARTSAELGLGIIVMASIFFFAIPRFHSAYLTGLGTHSENITGFSESVKLGDLGRLLRSGALVFRVLPEGNPRNYIGIKWQGVALDSFDGRHWYNDNTRRTAVQPVSPGRFIIPREPGSENRPVRMLRYKVLLSSISSNVIFVAACARQIRGTMHMLTIDETGSLHRTEHVASPIEYEVVSQVGLPSPKALRTAPATYSRAMKLLYLRLPPMLDPRIRQLAEKITAAATNPYDRAMDINIYLRDNFGYTLAAQKINPNDPIGSFLFKTRKGYCEYFASAMAIMLRTLGIPARLVNGFQTGSYNRYGRDFVVRARDAHSWVEVYFPGYGWIPFDPTPPDPHTVIASQFDNYMDALSLFWSEWVINYDFSHQMQLATQVEVQSRRLQRKVHHHLDSLRNQLAGMAMQWEGRLARHKFSLFLAVVGTLFGLLLVARDWNFRRLRFHWDYNVLRSDRPLSLEESTISYHHFLNIMDRKGYRKAPAETPQEFVLKLKGSPLAGHASEFTRLYNAARYGGEQPSLAVLRGLLQQISEIPRSESRNR